MRTLATLLLVTAATVCAAVTIAAEPGISLDHVWARASAGNATTGAAYFTVTDHGAADRLTGVASPVAAKVELHESINDNGVMKMRAVPSIPLETGKPVSLQPGGYHVMLMGLKNPLKVGDAFPLTVSFERAPPITVTVNVEAARPAAADHQHGATPGQASHKP